MCWRQLLFIFTKKNKSRGARVSLLFMTANFHNNFFLSSGAIWWKGMRHLQSRSCRSLLAEKAKTLEHHETCYFRWDKGDVFPIFTWRTQCTVNSEDRPAAVEKAPPVAWLVFLRFLGWRWVQLSIFVKACSSVPSKLPSVATRCLKVTTSDAVWGTEHWPFSRTRNTTGKYP